MLPLRRQAAVLGYHGPAVREQTHRGLARVDHGFDRQCHTLAQLHAGAGLAVVQHLGILVKSLANAVAAILAHDGVSVRFDVLLDGRKPSLMTVMSMLMASPDFSRLSPGIPWQTTLFTEVQIDFGKPR